MGKIHWIQNNSNQIDFQATVQPYLKPCITYLILSTHRVLLRTWRADDTEVDKIVLLAKLREDVLTKAHLAAGHIGSAKTFALLQKYFFGLAFKNQSTNIVKVAQLVFIICKYQDLDYLYHNHSSNFLYNWHGYYWTL